MGLHWKSGRAKGSFCKRCDVVSSFNEMKSEHLTWLHKQKVVWCSLVSRESGIKKDPFDFMKTNGAMCEGKCDDMV